MRRPHVDRMRKRVGLLPPRQTAVVPQSVFDNQPTLQRVLDRLSSRVTRSAPPGCRLRGSARVLHPEVRAADRQIEVAVYAEHPPPAAASNLDRLFERGDPPEHVMQRVRSSTRR